MRAVCPAYSIFVDLIIVAVLLVNVLMCHASIFRLLTVSLV